jgi:cobalt-precorrin-6B (C15)-methyltransferase
MIYPSGTPTQPEIITVALSKLHIKPTDIFADIGSGSGSVSINAAGLAKHVFAIENRDEAILATNENIKECGISNITVLKGDAGELLHDKYIDCAFVGGSKNISQVLEILMEKVQRFVVSMARIETVYHVVEILKRNNQFKELLLIQLSRGSELSEGTMLKPENPVFLIVGGSC